MGEQSYSTEELAAIRRDFTMLRNRAEKVEAQRDAARADLQAATASLTDLLTAARHLLDCSQASEPQEVEALRALERAVSRAEKGERE